MAADERWNPTYPDYSAYVAAYAAQQYAAQPPLPNGRPPAAPPLPLGSSSYPPREAGEIGGGGGSRAAPWGGGSSSYPSVTMPLGALLGGAAGGAGGGGGGGGAMLMPPPSLRDPPRSLKGVRSKITETMHRLAKVGVAEGAGRGPPRHLLAPSASRDLVVFFSAPHVTAD